MCMTFWWGSGEICDCKWRYKQHGGDWFCYLDGEDRDSICISLTTFLRKLVGLIFIALYIIMLLRILCTIRRVIGPIQLLKELEMKKNKQNKLEASIQSLLGDHPELERMLHWRRLTIPRLDLMDWAAWNFRQTAGLFADHSDGLAALEQRKILTSLTRRLHFFFRGLAPGRSGGSFEGALQVLEGDLSQLRDRARAAPADLDLFSHHGAVETIIQNKRAEAKKNFLDIPQNPFLRMEKENAQKEEHSIVTVDDLRSMKILADAQPVTYSMLCSPSVIEMEMSEMPPARSSKSRLALS